MNKNLKMRTPKSNRKEKSRKVALDDNAETLLKQSTPILKNNDGCMSDVSDDSPIFRCTQDGGLDDCEVVWDWNSPQRDTKQHRRKCSSRSLTRKQFEKSQSPLSSIPMRRKIIRKDTNGFNTLKERLEALNEKLSKQSKQNNLNNYKIENINNEEHKTESEEVQKMIKNEGNISKAQDSLETLFDEDDSFTDCLIRCSQEIEDKYYSKEKNKLNNNDDEVNNETTNLKLFEESKLKNKNHASTSQMKTFDYGDIKFDDSFDTILGSIDDNDIERMTVTFNTQNKKTEVHNDRSSENNFIFHPNSSFISKQTISTLMEKKITSNMNSSISSSIHKKIEKKTVFQEKRCVELKSSKSCPSEFQCTSEEIERKRLEAIAKLERKMKIRPKSSTSIHNELPNKFFQRRNNSFDNDTSKILNNAHFTTKFNELNQIPNKINSELKPRSIEDEIERKRREALARLQRTRNASQMRETSKLPCTNRLVER